jgi:hypothetical protein
MNGARIMLMANHIIAERGTFPVNARCGKSGEKHGEVSRKKKRVKYAVISSLTAKVISAWSMAKRGKRRINTGAFAGQKNCRMAALKRNP